MHANVCLLTRTQTYASSQRTDSSYRESLCANARAGMTDASSVQQGFNRNVTR